MGSLGKTVVWLILTIEVATCCPPQCSCQRPGEIDCINRNLTEIPGNLPLQGRKILLYGNYISELTSDVFSHRGYKYITHIYAPNCQIQKIHPYAFRGLGKLQVINLRGNLLKEIHPYTFSGIQGGFNKSRLILDSNPISTIHGRAFEGFQGADDYAKISFVSISLGSQEQAVTLKPLSFSGTTNTNLAIYGVKLRIEPWAFNKSKIHSFEFNRCQIQDIPARAFSGILSATHIRFQKSNLGRILTWSFSKTKFDPDGKTGNIFFDRSDIASLSSDVFVNVSNKDVKFVETSIEQVHEGPFRHLHTNQVSFVRSKLKTLPRLFVKDLNASKFVMIDLFVPSLPKNSLGHNKFGIRNMLIGYSPKYNKEKAIIKEYAFYGLSLDNLTLKNVNMPVLKRQMFAGLRKSKIMIYHSGLQSIDKHAFSKAQHIKLLDIQDAQLTCSCSTISRLEYLDDVIEHVIHPCTHVNKTTCVTPHTTPSSNMANKSMGLSIFAYAVLIALMH